MEGIEQEISEKVIEKSSEDPTPEPVVEKEKPKKKPRTQKQQEAFAKARAKRLENIAKQKAEENKDDGTIPQVSENPYVLPSDEPPEPVKKKR